LNVLKSFKYFVVTMTGMYAFGILRSCANIQTRERRRGGHDHFLARATNFTVNDSRAHHGGSYFARRTRS